MSRFWAIFFSLSAVAAVVYCALAPSYHLGFPGDGQARSVIGLRIDHLFYLVLAIVAIVFVGVHAALGYVLWRGATRPADQPARYTHGNYLLEIIWTVIPASLLIFIAFYQVDVWAAYRFKGAVPGDTSTVAEITARQFEWRIRYPGANRKLQLRPQPTDLHTVNELVVPANRLINVNLRTEDVQHSFFVPVLRFKQDAVPGRVIPIWFEVTTPGDYEIVCAELCGWGHYKMRARLRALEPDKYAAWQARQELEEFDDGTRGAVGSPVSTE